MRVYILCRNDEFQASQFFSPFSGNINIIIKPKIDGKINRISDLTEGFKLTA